MLRNAANRLLAVAAKGRSISTAGVAWNELAAAAGPQEFTEAWNKTAPSHLVVPELPSNFLPAGSAESAVEGDKFAVNFYTPHSVICQAAMKEEVTLPGVSGELGVKANHVPIIVQLKPGVIQLHNGSDVEKYFVPGGFAFVHPNGAADICALEAAPLDQFDLTAVKTALSTANSGAGSADEAEAVINAAAVELYSSLDSALESNK